MEKRRQTKEHQWLRVMAERNGLDESGRRRLDALDTGHAGECEFDRWIEEFGGEGWRVYRDVWIDAGGPTQIDTMIVMEAGIFIFDVKNYSGAYAYSGGKWSVNGRPLIKDIFVQLKRSMEKVQFMMREIDPSVPAEGAIIFINEHFSFEAEDAVQDRVVMRHCLKKHILGMARGQLRLRMPVEALCREIEAFFIDCPYSPPRCDAALYLRVDKGLRCHRCGEFEHEVMRYHFRCLYCGYREAKEKAVLRSICEYGVIRNDCMLRVADIHHFLGGTVGERYVRSILIKYFRVAARGRHAAYVNPGEVMEYLFSGMNFRYKDWNQE
ncbi:nuclease-related domain-containing protein [Salinicoccus roseus]|uniref:nuclease-related domain-containing protein n=1 Tax=Salinicoccus roseus TaxID=45670 RepID=UPI002301209E|nr:nuclease-related domain-containing protein [Salinicoccus roseus]